MINTFKVYPFLVCLLLTGVWMPAGANNGMNPLKVDRQKVRAWNNFADNLYKLHSLRMQHHEVKSSKRIGGYPDFPRYYEETAYYDKKTGKLLSRVKRIVAQPELVHEIEVNIYNEKGQLERDYLAAYLPYGRNAPVQTLVNLHGHNDGLHAFRQFDASGERIYEQCKQGKSGNILISLEYDDLAEGPYQNKKVMNSAQYKKCFANIPAALGGEHNPIAELVRLGHIHAVAAGDADAEQAFRLIEHYTQSLTQTPQDTRALLKRAELYFMVHEFDLAVEDFTEALALDDTLDEAYFGRGMALGRSGRIEEGIEDLSVYIQRRPQSSLAYTKRGVRYLWLGEEDKAKQDFQKALAIDPKNAEAHDDLGVIYARNGQYELAIGHFNQTLKHDPNYAKGYHNLAMVHYITGSLQPALGAIDKALDLSPEARDTMLLKAQILEALGRTQEARRITDEAEFLPEGNWSEMLSIN